MTMKAFGCKLDEELIIQVKMRAMLTRTLMRDVVTRALIEYLDNQAEEASARSPEKNSENKFLKN